MIGRMNEWMNEYYPGWQVGLWQSLNFPLISHMKAGPGLPQVEPHFKQKQAEDEVGTSL